MANVGAERFDLLVVGSGPAGEKAAAQAAYFGRQVAVVERDRPGGTMVAGAVSTKTMREAALYLTGFTRDQVYGVGLDLLPEALVDRLRAREAHVRELMTEAVRRNLARHDIAYVEGTARLGGPEHTLTVTPAGGRPERVLAADAILLAPGSRPFHPPGIPFDDPDVLDSETAGALDQPLQSLVVVGGGAVACEYASIFQALGASVVLVDRGPRLLPFLDADISALLADIFSARGMRILPSTGVAGVTRTDGMLCVATSAGEALATEKVIFAAGRIGNTEQLGLKDAGVATDDRGRILVDDHYETSVPGIYAAGDVIGPPALASVSMEQGRVAACYAMGIPFKQTVDPLTPFGVYTIPECAMVGLTQQQAQEAGIEHVVGVARFEDNSRAAIAGAGEGALKLVVRADDRRLLGVHIIGEGATELIHQGQAVMHFGGTLDYFIHSTFDVPTVSDSYKYAAYDCLQRLQVPSTS